MANEMNQTMNGQMMGAPAQAQQSKVNTNMCNDGDRAVVKGKLGFSYYLTRPKMGEALAKSIQEQKMRGMKFVNEKPRFEATIAEPEIVLDGRTPAEATMLEKYLHQKFYTNKDGIECMSFEKVVNPNKVQLPAFKMRGTGEKLSLANQSLAEGQTIYITFEIKDSNKGNKGCYVRLIEFEKEPEFFVSDNEYGETWTPASQPTAPVQQMPADSGWGAPAPQTAPVGNGFTPAQDGAAYTDASFWQ